MTLDSARRQHLMAVVPRAVQMRSARPPDQPFLRDMLYTALFVPAGSPPFPRSVLRRRAIARYVSDWGHRAGDVGVIAVAGQFPVGAAWLRRFGADDPGYGFVAETIPELTIAVVVHQRGGGIGGRMIAWLQEREHSISLSCDPANPAQRLYVRRGFEGLPDGRRMLWTRDVDSGLARSTRE